MVKTRTPKTPSIEVIKALVRRGLAGHDNDCSESYRECWVCAVHWWSGYWCNSKTQASYEWAIKELEGR